MTDATPNPKIVLLKELLESAEASLQAARNALNELVGDKEVFNKYAAAAGRLPATNGASNAQTVVGGKVIEGVFDGQNMVGNDQKTYPVPANYASKSKLIPGDVLKLTISNDGNFIYKQIGPVPRKQLVGVVSYDNGQYKVIVDGKVYNVLLASITYFKAEIGDNVAIIVPLHEESAWGAIENLIPTSEDEKAAYRATLEKTQKENNVKEKATRKAAAKAKKNELEPELEEYTL